MANRQQFDELRGLLESMDDGTISADGIDRIDQLTRTDPALLRSYLEYVQMVSDLRFGPIDRRIETTLARAFGEEDWAREDERRPLAPAKVEEPPAWSIVRASGPFLTALDATLRTIGSLSERLPFKHLAASILVGLGILMGLLAFFSPPAGPVAKDSASPARQPSTERVAWITGMVDCKWVDPAMDSNPTGAVCLGWKCALVSGLLEITYDTGGKVLLQGPATYEVESKSGGFLTIGKLTGKLEKKAEVKASDTEESQSTTPGSPFTIRTPTATVTDLGTEFGIEVNRQGMTASRVFRGSIQVQPLGGAAPAAYVLREDESACVHRDAQGHAVVVNQAGPVPASFVQFDQFHPLVRQTQGTFSSPRRQFYSEKIRRDPTLVAYYRFQCRKDSPNVLYALGHGMQAKLDGAIEHAVWSDGRVPGTTALQFDGVSARVRVLLSQRLTQMTLAAWVAIGPADEKSPACAILMSDGSGKPGDSAEKCHWQIERTGEISLGTADHRVKTSSVLPRQQWDSNRWRHLAVTTDPTCRQVACYLDGKQVLTERLSERFAAAFGHATIGNWKSPTGKFEHGLCGRMDELVILLRAMTAQEIREMADVGRP